MTKSQDSTVSSPLQLSQSLPLDQIIEGDAATVLKAMPDSSIDLIVTSPPYANNRKTPYIGVPVGQYVEWFLPIADQLHRVLKADGSFILNVKERAIDWERQTYVIELILELKKRQWLWIEEYIWHKKNSYPGKWPNRFRDAWERCLHFAKNKRFRMYQDKVMIPRGKWARGRLASLNEIDKIRDESRVGSGFSKNVSNWIGRDFVYPTNVLYNSTESSNKQHSAAFPIYLPKWFIRLFTEPGDVVLDPFIGSGTTARAAKSLGRHFVGIEISPDYCQLARESLASVQTLDVTPNVNGREPHQARTKLETMHGQQQNGS